MISAAMPSVTQQCAHSWPETRGLVPVENGPDEWIQQRPSEVFVWFRWCQSDGRCSRAVEQISICCVNTAETKGNRLHNPLQKFSQTHSCIPSSLNEIVKQLVWNPFNERSGVKGQADLCHVGPKPQPLCNF